VRGVDHWRQWKPLQQCPLTCWIFATIFIGISLLNIQRLRHAGISVNGYWQRTAGRPENMMLSAVTWQRRDLIRKLCSMNMTLSPMIYYNKQQTCDLTVRRSCHVACLTSLLVCDWSQTTRQLPLKLKSQTNVQLSVSRLIWRNVRIHDYVAVTVVTAYAITSNCQIVYTHRLPRLDATAAVIANEVEPSDLTANVNDFPLLIAAQLEVQSIANPDN